MDHVADRRAWFIVSLSLCTRALIFQPGTRIPGGEADFTQWRILGSWNFLFLSSLEFWKIWKGGEDSLDGLDREIFKDIDKNRGIMGGSSIIILIFRMDLEFSG